MIGFIRKLWRRHKVKAADRRMYVIQGHSSGNRTDSSQRIAEIGSEHRYVK
jgi:hypothetical protein